MKDSDLIIKDYLFISGNVKSYTEINCDNIINISGDKRYDNIISILRKIYVVDKCEIIRYTVICMVPYNNYNGYKFIDDEFFEHFGTIKDLRKKKLNKLNENIRTETKSID